MQRVDFYIAEVAMTESKKANPNFIVIIEIINSSYNFLECRHGSQIIIFSNSIGTRQ